MFGTKIEKLLKKIKKMGFEISHDNRSVILTNDKATEVYNNHFSDRAFMLGQIPSNNENLLNVEADIAFDVIERYSSYLSYNHCELLNSFAEQNDIPLFIERSRDNLSNSSIEIGNLINDVWNDYTLLIDELEWLLSELK
jgi:hypothetical protein